MTATRTWLRGATTARSFRAMASPVTFTVVEPNGGAPTALDRAEAAVREIERTCSRFDPTSALTWANAAPHLWHDVPASLALAVREAAEAHLVTAGRFDPRVLGVLLGWGYDRSLPFAEGVERDAGPRAAAPVTLGSWCPEVVERNGRWRLRLGAHPIDLGGIGKGLAVRAAAAELAGSGAGWMVDLGGDGAVAGVGPDGGGWRIGVEDPTGGELPLLVLEATDTGYATSSTRLRSWRASGQRVHHLVDPRTGEPGGDGLRAVTVVSPDPAWSEVWTKELFLAGPAAVARTAADLQLAATWVEPDGAVRLSPRLEPLVLWRRSHG
jgi:thiamine biosynthesis lipoprotein